MKKFLSILCALAMVFASVASVSASNYTPVAGTTTELDKYLVVEADAEIPAAEFTFSVSAGSPAEATADTVKVWAGLNPELVKVNGTAESGVVTFAAGEEATNANAKVALADDTTDKLAAKHTIGLDFSGVNFPEPGVYRYLLTEAAAAQGSPISHDAQPIRTIDVYVEDNNGTLVVTDYVSYLGNVNAAAPANAMDMSDWLAENAEPVEADYDLVANGGDGDGEISSTEHDAYEQALGAWNSAKDAEEARLLAEVPNGAEAGTKSDKYVNEMDSSDLTVSKTVTGNQGSKDQYFEFTITIGNAGAGTVMTLDTTGAETDTHENSATTFAKADMDEANQRDDDNAEGSEAVLYTQEDWDAYLAENNNEEPSWAIGDVKTPAVAAGKAGQQIIADANGAATITVYLHHGQNVVLKGLPVGATYKVEETDAAGYTTTGEVATPTAIESEDVEVAVVNNREGVIPTGVMTSIAGGAALVAIAGAGIVLANRKKEEE